MNHPALLRSVLAAATAAAFTVPATAQLVQNLALANGTHSWGAPYWTEDLPDANAEAGVVDHLNYVWWLELHSTQVVLQPGTYIAQAKVAKMSSTSGRFDLTIEARAGTTVLGSSLLAAASQTVDTYVWSPEVIFTVHQPTAVDVVVRNTSGTQYKQNYRFDTARIGFVPVGPVVQHESLDTWGYANEPYYDRYVVEPGSVYGRVAQRNALNGLTWLDLRKTRSMAAGTHVANVRLRNTNGLVLGGSYDMTLEAIDPVTFNVLASVTIPQAAQTAGTWVTSPDLVLVLPQAQDVTFAVYNHLLLEGFGYQFDSFSVRSSAPSFTAYGAGCGGLTLAQSVGGQVGTSMTFDLGNGGAALVGIFAFGSPVPSIPLDFLGATGCLLHVTPDVLLSGVFAGGTCSASIPVPNLATMFGLTLDIQGAALDPTAPGALKTANAGQTYIGL
ncbi:MAG: hypothetical protein JNK15_19215 [Planctomycetes bacterium]|nr:hypothetical protein [Planctomycetota bacterium]